MAIWDVDQVVPKHRVLDGGAEPHEKGQLRGHLLVHCKV